MNSLFHSPGWGSWGKGVGGTAHPVGVFFTEKLGTQRQATSYGPPRPTPAVKIVDGHKMSKQCQHVCTMVHPTPDQNVVSHPYPADTRRDPGFLPGISASSAQFTLDLQTKIPLYPAPIRMRSTPFLSGFSLSVVRAPAIAARLSMPLGHSRLNSDLHT